MYQLTSWKTELGFKKYEVQGGGGRQQWRPENGDSRRAIHSTQRRGREHSRPFEWKVVAWPLRALSVVLKQPLPARAQLSHFCLLSVNPGRLLLGILSQRKKEEVEMGQRV